MFMVTRSFFAIRSTILFLKIFFFYVHLALEVKKDFVVDLLRIFITSTDKRLTGDKGYVYGDKESFFVIRSTILFLKMCFWCSSCIRRTLQWKQRHEFFRRFTTFTDKRFYRWHGYGDKKLFFCNKFDNIILGKFFLVFNLLLVTIKNLSVLNLLTVNVIILT